MSERGPAATPDPEAWRLPSGAGLLCKIRV
jgi:hypothetical protein